MTARGLFQSEFFNVSLISDVLFLFVFFCASVFLWLCLVISSETCMRNNFGWPRFEDLLNDNFGIQEKWSFFHLHKCLIYKSWLACFIDLPISKNFCSATTAAKKILAMGVTQVGKRKGDSVTHQ